MAKMHILLVTFFFPPEIGAPAMRAFELARIMHGMNIKISVLTGIPNYPLGRYYDGYARHSLTFENMHGIDVYRSYIHPSDNSSKFNRLRSYFTFQRSAKHNGKKIQQINAVIGTTPPLVTPGISYFIAKKHKVPLILEFRDLTYKQILATKYANRMIVHIIKYFELAWAKKADHIITVTEGYKHILKKNSIDEKKIHVIKNGFDFIHTQQAEYTLRVQAMIEEIRRKKKNYHITIGYFGVMGISQNILSLVHITKNVPNVLLVLIGGGAQYKSIKDFIRKEAPSNILLYESITEAEIIPFYNEVDFNLSVLRDSPEFAPTIPSKIFRIMGYGAIPLFLGPDGEAALLVKSIDPRLHLRDVTRFPSFKPHEIFMLKSKSYLICKKYFNRHVQAEKYIEVINGISNE